jgi:nanoRNase/pAp phosphatase (c-di-AMP/oligoRNAs hydrolase)
MLQINEIFPLLKDPKNVVITTHQKPDGDAMGSSLGLFHFLKQFMQNYQTRLNFRIYFLLNHNFCSKYFDSLNFDL